MMQLYTCTESVDFIQDQRPLNKVLDTLHQESNPLPAVIKTHS